MRNPLDTTPWLVELDADTARAYSIMREAEERWLEALQINGCKLHHLPHDRRVVVLVPISSKLPSHKEMANSRSDYIYLLRQLAAEQNKEATVGARSGSLPHWIGGDVIGSRRPKFEVTRVRWRTQTAYRAGNMTPEQAISYLKGRRDRQEAILANAEANYRKDRLDRLKEKLLEVNQAYIKALDFVQNNPDIKARVISGTAIKLSVYGKDKKGQSVSFQASLPSIALVSAAECCTFEEAPKRERSGRVSVMARFDNVEFYA